MMLVTQLGVEIYVSVGWSPDPWASWSIRTYSDLFGDTWRYPLGIMGKKEKQKWVIPNFWNAPHSPLPNRGGKTWCPGLGFRVALQLHYKYRSRSLWWEGRGYWVTAILRRLQELGGVCIPSIVRDSKCEHHLLLTPKTSGWVADKVWWGGALSPLSLPPHKQPEDLLFSGGGEGRRTGS